MENIISTIGIFIVGFSMGMLFESINSFKNRVKEFSEGGK